MTTLSEYLIKMVEILPSDLNVETIPFEEGFSNEVYLLRWEQIARLVLRIPSIDCDAFYINRTEEIQTMKDAASIKLSPEVAWHDGHGAFACKFVHQPSLDWTVEHKDKDVIRLAKHLAKAHRLPARKHKYSIMDVIRFYIERIESLVSNDTVLRLESEYLFSILESCTAPKKLLPSALCHNDLNPKNTLMDDEKLWFIDWEYSGVGDPLFDLAVVVKSHNLDERQMMLLLSSYNADLNINEAMLAVSEHSKLYSLREMAWLFLKHLVTPDDALSLEYYYEFKATPKLNPFLVD